MNRSTLATIADQTLTNLINQSPLRRGFRLLVLALAFAMILTSLCLAPALGAGVSPAPDGGYSGENTAEGQFALGNLSYPPPANGRAFGNTAVGFEALGDMTTGIFNTGIGLDALTSNTTGDFNTAVGAGALRGNPGMPSPVNHNTAVGTDALSSNITDDNTAVGFQALTSNYTGGPNTATGSQALHSNSMGGHNTANGYSALHENTASNNTGTGSEALYFNITGNNNTANGAFALIFNKIGSNNTGNGCQALLSNNGNDNTADGFQALLNNKGDNNIALGSHAGSNLTTGSNNIDIAALGNAGEANTIRIGKLGVQKKAYMQGVFGVAPGSATGVIVNSSGQLGTMPSAARFKDEIKPMDKTSEAILALKPVSFRYKKELDPTGVRQFGLVAEDVEKVNPDLVVRDEDGKVSTVRYEAVNAMLLNEFLKEHRRLQQIEKELRATIAKQQKQIQALTMGLQKVSEQLISNDPALQTAAND